MKLQNRIELLLKLNNYLKENNTEWQNIKCKASSYNGWFIPEFIDKAVESICSNYLQKDKINSWAFHYRLDDNISPKNIGIVMAGNIPLVGFHDFLSVFISGHHQTIKLSSKDDILLKHLIVKMCSWDSEINDYVQFADMLKGCDAYIATGSNNTARYFEQYFGKYPSIIRRNKTSVGILLGNETEEELNKLSDDVHLYFGLGCRNISQIYVPLNYNFIPLLKAFDNYKFLADNNKYKNNYDYQLSIALLNNVYYMTNESTLLIENTEIFSAISQLNYCFYDNLATVQTNLKQNELIQCIIEKDGIPFGYAQRPSLFDYADGIDTIQFLLTL